MSNTATKKRTTSASSVKSTQETTADVSAMDSVSEDVAKEHKVSEDACAISYKKPELDPNMYISVKNGFNGTLVYKSRRTGERFVWEEFGDEQEIELQELKNARNASKSFFINNWFLFDDPDVIEWLGVGQYYKNSLSADRFVKLFEMKPDDIMQTVKKLSAGQKTSLIFRAKQMIRDEEIDSIKTIDALEKALGVELMEH